VRPSLSALLSHARVWVSSDLETDAEALLAPLSARWDREVLVAAGKEARGLDHSQPMRAQSQVALVDAGLAGLRHATSTSSIACVASSAVQAFILKIVCALLVA
jgi:hypothetical protein